MADELASLPSDGELFKSAVAPEPAAAEPPAPEVPTPEAPTPTPEPTPEPAKAGAEDNVPSWRLREEAEARRVAEARAAKVEADLEELVTAIRGEASRQQPKPAEEPPDFFADPPKAVQTLVMQSLQPIVEHLRRSEMAMAKLYAQQEHTGKVVEEAEKAFMKAVSDRSLDTMEYEAVVQSPNRYDAVVKWHKNATLRSTVGNDPEAYFMNTLKTRASDPAFQQQLLELLKGAPSGNGAKPSVVQLPPSLSTVTSAARSSGENLAGIGDAELFRFARDSKG